MEEKSINKSKWVYFKFCTRCKEYFKEHSFRGVYCKDCKREIDAAYRLKNKDKDLSYRKIYRETRKKEKAEYDRLRRKKSLPAEEIVVVSEKEAARAVKDYNLKRTYNISLNEWEDLFRKQSFKCAICRSDKNIGNSGDFHTDHCHKTMKVRGILCSRCNTAIGAFEENIEYLKNAISYLEAYKNDEKYK